MGHTVEIRLGLLDCLKWLTWAVLFAAVGGMFLLPDLAGESGEPIAPWLAYFLIGWAVLFAVLALRSYRRHRNGHVVVTLSDDGIQGRPTQGVLVPWSQVTKVRRVTRHPSTFALGAQSFWVGFLVEQNQPFRYDAYEVELDWGLAKTKGVKGEHLAGIGFDLVPALMSFSSAQVAQAFARWLPADKCLDFDNRADPGAAVELAERVRQTVVDIASHLDVPNNS